VILAEVYCIYGASRPACLLVLPRNLSMICLLLLLTINQRYLCILYLNQCYIESTAALVLWNVDRDCCEFADLPRRRVHSSVKCAQSGMCLLSAPVARPLGRRCCQQCLRHGVTQRHQPSVHGSRTLTVRWVLSAHQFSRLSWHGTATARVKRRRTCHNIAGNVQWFCCSVSDRTPPWF